MSSKIFIISSPASGARIGTTPTVGVQDDRKKKKFLVEFFSFITYIRGHKRIPGRFKILRVNETYSPCHHDGWYN